MASPANAVVSLDEYNFTAFLLHNLPPAIRPQLRPSPRTYRMKVCSSLVHLGVHQDTLPPSPYELTRDSVCCLTWEDLGDRATVSGLESSSYA